jgi:hypothetical protein
LRLAEIDEDPDSHQAQFEALYAYIDRHWKHSFDDLRTKPFNLEECFTLIQQQRGDASDFEEQQKLLQVEEQLIQLLRRFLSEFDLYEVEYNPQAGHHSYTEAVRDFLRLAEIIVEESAAVLSFNYDLLLEYAFQTNSGVTVPSNPRTDPSPEGADVTDSHFNWNAPLAYRVRFDDVGLHQPGPTTYVSGEKFYGAPENQLYYPPLLKLHGSLNWFVYTKYRMDLSSSPGILPHSAPVRWG